MTTNIPGRRETGRATIISRPSGRLSGMSMTASRLILFFICWYVWAAPAAAGQAAKDDDVIMLVGEEKVTRADLEQAITSIYPISAQFHPSTQDDKRAKYRDQAINFLIDRELLYRGAVIAGLKPDKKAVEQAIEENVARFGSRKKFEEELVRQGSSLTEFSRAITKDDMVTRYAYQEIDAKTGATDADVAEHYERHREQFVRPPAVHLWHIFIKVPANAGKPERERKKAFAEGVAEKAGRGEDFSLLAEKYSEDEYRVKGGYLGAVQKSQLPVAALADAAFGLEKGGVAGPVESIYGYHIFKAGDRVAQGQIPLDEIRAELKKKIETERHESLKRNLLARLREGVRIEILDDGK